MQDQDENRVEASARTPPPDRLTWSITEAAQVLGISRASAYEAAHRGELPVRGEPRNTSAPKREMS